MFYARALYKFHQKLPDEIPLHIGDVLLVDHILDDNWYVGSNLKNEHGSFPINYVERISFPKFKDEKLFAATKDFSTHEPGDLQFCKGDIIKGKAEIDENWWSGVVLDDDNNEVGIFPLTHVAMLNDHLSDGCPNEDCSGLSRDEFNVHNKSIINTNNYNDVKAKYGHKRNGSWYNQSNTKSLDAFVKPYAKTLYPYEARDPDELSFLDNEIIRLLQHFSGGWSKGEIDGREGLFPTAYVEIIVDCSPSITEIENSCDNLKLLNSSGSDIVHGDIDKELYGRVLCNFSSSSSDQIDLEEGDTVTILSKIDDNWYRARHDDGRIGFCPSNCMEIFGAEPELPSPVIKEQFEKPSLKPKPLTKAKDNARPNDLKSNDKRYTYINKLVEELEKKGTDLNEIKALSTNKPQIHERRRVSKDKACNLSRSYTSIIRSPLNETPTPDIVPAVKPKLVPTRPAPTIHKIASADLIQFSPEHETKNPSPNKSSTLHRHLTSSGFSYLQPNLNPNSPAYVHKKPIPKPDMKSTPKASEVVKSDRKDKVLEELVKTESDYLTSLELCKMTLTDGKSSGHCPNSVDLDSLFSNIDEVIELSRMLLQSLNESTHTAFMECGNVGQCFLRLESDFKRVYAPYCRNHDSVLALLEKYEGDKDAQAFFKKMTDSMKESIVVFDLASILIKPVQRILKYPLLLSELNKCTDDSIPSKEDILSAVQCMTDIALYINEFKRKQDLVSKYKHEKDENLSDRIQKLNIHSTKKKLARFGQLIVGVQTIDEDFNKEEQKFRAIENLVRNLIKDLTNFTVNSQDCSSATSDVVEEVSNFYGSVSSEMEIDSMKDDFENVMKNTHARFKSKIESEIIPSLNSLLVMFRGPSKVIKKRYDKLLDYENSTRLNVTAGDGVAKDQNNSARSNYEALNSQLLDELPTMNKLSLDILHLLLSSFVSMKNDYHKQTSMQMKRLLDYKFMAPENQDLKLNVAQQFNIGHTAAVDLLSHLTFVPFTFNPMAYELKKSRRLTMDDSLLSKVNFDPFEDNAEKLASKYPPEKLFRVSRSFSGSQAMDVRLPEGAVVAVLKEGDPMGNSERWFIDDSSSKGFILKSHLEPFVKTSLQDVISSPSHTSNHLECDANPKYNSNRLSAPIIPKLPQPPTITAVDHHNQSIRGSPMTPTPASRQKASDRLYLDPSKTNDILLGPSPRHSLSSPVFSSPTPLINLGNNNQRKVKVLFDFNARSDLELSVSKGQICTLLQSCDLTGNKDWWFLSDDDKKCSGYVPANYLLIIQS